MKKLVIVFLVALLSVSQFTVAAAGVDKPILDPSIKSSNVVHIKDGQDSGGHIQASTPSNDLILRWGGGIKDAGNLEVEFHGFTECYKTSDKGRLNFYVQKWNGSLWSTITTRYYTGYNRFYYFDHHLHKVSSPGYYRLKITHFVETGSYFEYQYTTTNSIYVD
jgi:hypothetical protein